MSRITPTPMFALPAALADFIARGLERGAAPHPLVELNTQVPSLGPYVMDNGGMFVMTVYTGPTMRFVATPRLGGNLNVPA